MTAAQWALDLEILPGRIDWCRSPEGSCERPETWTISAGARPDAGAEVLELALTEARESGKPVLVTGYAVRRDAGGVTTDLALILRQVHVLPSGELVGVIP